MTLIELLLAMFVISLVSMVGLPAYQDYQVRSRVAQDIDVAHAATAGIAEYFGAHGALPQNFRDAGMVDLEASNFRLYLGGYGDYRATLVVVYDTDQLPQLRDKNTLLFKSSERNGELIWNCQDGGNMPAKYRPESCR
jgi:type IV pilus assembly protein PilA